MAIPRRVTIRTAIDAAGLRSDRREEFGSMTCCKLALATFSVALLAAVAVAQQPDASPPQNQPGAAAKEAQGREQGQEQAENQQQPQEQQKEPSGQFLRLVRGEDDSLQAMETAIVRCVPMDCGQQSPTVDLVAAVHVGEKSYYAQLNREFTQYDAVLYELVAPPDSKVPKNGRSDNPVSALQNGMKTMLGLEFQLDRIDYGVKNMVHADMSPEQFNKTMDRRGESLWTMFLRMMGYAMTQQKGTSKTSDFQLLLALLDKNRAFALKRIMAEQFEDMDGTLTALDGPDGSTIVTERNKVALKVLEKQLGAGKQKVAIFYGAGHMADLQRRLRNDFGLVPISTRWVVAWNLAPPSDTSKTPNTPEDDGSRKQ